MLEQFYRENHRIVCGYLLSLCGDPALAEELAAETFCRALERIDRYDPARPPAAWLCTIARNLYCNERRRKKRLTGLEEAAALAAPSAEAVHLRREELARVLAAVDRRPPEQREAFLMRLHGLSFREIGLALGRSEVWARVTFFRIKGQLTEGGDGE